MAKTRIALLENFNRPYKIRALEIPRLGQGEDLVRITAAGLCGSDIHIFEGRDDRVQLPLVPGHQGVGTIQDIPGEHSDYITGEKLRAGDKIVWNRGVSCGECRYCVELKRPNICPERWTYGISKPHSTSPHLNGTLAEHIILHPSTQIINVGEYPFDDAEYVPLTCAGATMANAFRKAARHETGETILIQGTGPLGLVGILFARQTGFSRVIVTGGTAERLAVAKEFGADMVFDRRTTSVAERKELVSEITGGLGVDCGIETSGAVEAFREGLDLLRRGAQYLLPGFGHPGIRFEFDLFNLTAREINIQGVWTNTVDDLVCALETIAPCREKYRRLIAGSETLDGVNKSFEKLKNRKIIQSIIIP